MFLGWVPTACEPVTLQIRCLLDFKLMLDHAFAFGNDLVSLPC